jgi:threonine/homoserine/homoserine lactone efflux protein
VSFTAFLVAAGVLAITPGPGLAYVVARTLSGGRLSGLASCLGTALGGMFHVLTAALGLSLVVAKSALAFAAMKYVGAAYLAFLGIVILWRRDSEPRVETALSHGMRRALIDGMVVEAFNVKTALFFLAFLPQFIAPSSPVFAQVASLGSICVLLNTMADIAAVLVADRVRTSGTVRGIRARLLTRLSGVTMLGLAASTALVRRQN